jgi:hypothetical protein
MRLSLPRQLLIFFGKDCRSDSLGNVLSWRADHFILGEADVQVKGLLHEIDFEI